MAYIEPLQALRDLRAERFIILNWQKSCQWLINHLSNLIFTRLSNESPSKCLECQPFCCFITWFAQNQYIRTLPPFSIDIIESWNGWRRPWQWWLWIWVRRSVFSLYLERWTAVRLPQQMKIYRNALGKAKAHFEEETQAKGSPIIRLFWNFRRNGLLQIVDMFPGRKASTYAMITHLKFPL